MDERRFDKEIERMLYFVGVLSKNLDLTRNQLVAEDEKVKKLEAEVAELTVRLEALENK